MFEKKYLDQVRIILDILPFIRKFGEFAIKGGTAINFFVFNLPRLSVDIDLCYLPVEEREESFARMNKIMEEISESIKVRFPDYSLSLNRSGNANIGKLIISGNHVSVKIEPNEVLRGFVRKPEIKSISKEVSSIFNLLPEARILAVPDLFGGKICAALDRQHPRDLFDIHMMIRNRMFNREIRKVFLIYLIQSSRPISEMLDPNKLDISRSFNNEFSGMIKKDITIDQLYSARDKLISKIKMNLTSNEKEFLLSVKSGEPNWKKLGIGDYSHLPGVQWKLHNLNKMNKTKKSEAYNKLAEVLNY